jgi:alpha-galactosidase
MMAAGSDERMGLYGHIRQALAHFNEEKNGRRSGVHFGSPEIDLAFYSSGWQSWSYAGLVGAYQSMPRTRLGLIRRPMIDQPGASVPRGQGRVRSDMFGVLLDRISYAGILAGFLSQRAAFGTVVSFMGGEKPSLHLRTNLDGVLLDPGGSFISDWACIDFIDTESSDPLSTYLDLAANENSARVANKSPLGWCSWYYYFQEVHQSHVQDHLQWAKEYEDEIPLEVYQIDDGYQSNIGDWLTTNERFPGGMAQLAGDIQGAGYEAGLWIAPFIALSSAQVVQTNPDWVLRNRYGLPVNTGWVWESFGRALDVTHPGVQEDIVGVIDTVVNSWGYSYIKLDFLYAAALTGKRYNPRLTGAQALRKMLMKIREMAGEESTLVGCGCPLGSGIGIFDSMRVGPDVAPSWKPRYAFIDAPIQNELDLPSARNALHNTITRAPLHRRWWINDPDCLLLRRTETQLSEAEVQALVTVVALSGGAAMVSDDLLALDAERRSWLARICPPLPGRMRVVDLLKEERPKLLLMELAGAIGKWWLIAILNWADEEQHFEIPLEVFGLNPLLDYHSVDFWNAQYKSVHDSVLRSGPIAAHGVELIALREARDESQWVGDTLHISQGLCVKSWDHRDRTLTVMIDCERGTQGQVWLALPGPPKSLRIQGHELEYKAVSPKIYSVCLEIYGSAILEVE